jgi:hypothetical protein
MSYGLLHPCPYRPLEAMKDLCPIYYVMSIKPIIYTLFYHLNPPFILSFRPLEAMKDLTGYGGKSFLLGGRYVCMCVYVCIICVYVCVYVWLWGEELPAGRQVCASICMYVYVCVLDICYVYVYMYVYLTGYGGKSFLLGGR